MPTITDEAENHEPTGDPSHVAYAADYYWTCSCGAGAATLTDRGSTILRGQYHERQCIYGGDVTIEVSLPTPAHEIAPDINPVEYHRIGCEHDRPHALRHRITEGIYR